MSEIDPFQTLASHIAYQNPWITVEHQEVLRPDGKPGIYGIVRFANRAVGVLPIDETGHVWMVGQFRRPVEAWSWEMPEGGAPFDEDPLEGARRELAEEAGLAAAHWLPACKAEMSNSVTDERAMAWIAWGLTPVPVAPDPTEIIRIVRVPFGDLLREIGTGAIRDMFTLATALRAYHMAREGELPPELAKAMLSGV
jgi:8-oxo-dGTP pyrophosphatase MutT (NUDIX family)